MGFPFELLPAKGWKMPGYCLRYIHHFDEVESGLQVVQQGELRRQKCELKNIYLVLPGLQDLNVSTARLMGQEDVSLEVFSIRESSKDLSYQFLELYDLVKLRVKIGEILRSRRLR